MESSGRGASSVRGLLFGDPEGPREEGSEDGYVCSPGTQGTNMSVHWEL